MKVGKRLLIGLLCGVLFGCSSTPLADNPMPLYSSPTGFENPVMIAPGQTSPEVFAGVFRMVLDVVDDYFPIAYSNIYDRRIVSAPMIAPGIEQPWKPGSPSLNERVLATFQTIRYRCFADVRPGEFGGYLVNVVVFRELKDEITPQIALAPAVFRDAVTVDRQFQLVDPASPGDERWIPKGREHALEQAILRKIQARQFE